jgi:putative phage-type endonuclease
MKLLNLEQGTREWHAWRAEKIGGSDVGPILLGDAWPFKDSRVERLFEQKVTGKRNTETTFPMRRGNYMERDVRRWYEVSRNCEALPICIEHDEIPWMAASLDGLVYRDGRPERLLEIKVPDWRAHDCALAGIVPPYYRPQVQYQMMVSGLDRCDYTSCTVNKRYSEKNKYASVSVFVDAEYQAEILEKTEAFVSRLSKAIGRPYGVQR